MPTLRPWKGSALPVGLAAAPLCPGFTGEMSRGAFAPCDFTGEEGAPCWLPTSSDAPVRTAGGGVLRPERASAPADPACAPALGWSRCSFGTGERRTGTCVPRGALPGERPGSAALRAGSRTGGGALRWPCPEALICDEAACELFCCGVVEICMLRSRSTKEDRAESGRSEDDSGRRLP